MDIRAIHRTLPHRYPMLLVDRVIEMDGEHRAVGIKNVTMNEHFFQGHYPGTPIMPGVLIIEAMAQLGGLLLSQRLEHTGKIAVRTARQVRDDVAAQRGHALPPMLVSSAVTAGGQSPPFAHGASHGNGRIKMQMDHLGAGQSAGLYG